VQASCKQSTALFQVPSRHAGYQSSTSSTSSSTKSVANLKLVTDIIDAFKRRLEDCLSDMQATLMSKDKVFLDCSSNKSLQESLKRSIDVIPKLTLDVIRRDPKCAGHRLICTTAACLAKFGATDLIRTRWLVFHITTLSSMAKGALFFLDFYVYKYIVIFAGVCWQTRR
jgi:hypothetical protein